VGADTGLACSVGLRVCNCKVPALQRELVDPPPCPTLRAMSVIRSIESGPRIDVKKRLKWEPALIHERCPLPGMTPLLAVLNTHSRPENDETDFVRWLLDNGADPGARDWQGRCALRLAYPDQGLMALLLERGARPRPYILDGVRWTLLSVAASQGNLQVLRLLLEWHAKSGLFTAAELDEARGRAQPGTAAEVLIQIHAKRSSSQCVQEEVSPRSQRERSLEGWTGSDP
jgi:hypothetical protein